MPSQPGIISKITNSCQTECTEFCQAQDKIRNRLEDKIYALKLNNIPNSIYIIFNLYLRKGCEKLWKTRIPCIYPMFSIRNIDFFSSSAWPSLTRVSRLGGECCWTHYNDRTEHTLEITQPSNVPQKNSIVKGKNLISKPSKWGRVLQWE